MANANEPAYPVVEISRNGELLSYRADGLTKREAFAMAAMQGLLANQRGEAFAVHTPEGVLHIPARRAVPMLAIEYADALLAELAKDKA